MTNQHVRKYKVWEPLLLAIVAVLGMIAGAEIAKSGGHDDGMVSSAPSTKADRVTEMIRFIEEKYVDDVDPDVLIEKAIQSILSELDPHSSYISPKDLASLSEKMEGHFEGIGIEFHLLLDTVTVLSVMDGGPAEEAGIKPLDRIVMTDDSSLVGIEINSEVIAKRLRGEKGSTVTVKVRRDGVDSLLTFQLTRDKIAINSVETAYMLDDDTGYFKLSRFSSTTYKEFMLHLEELIENEGLAHIVLDLRQNPGGYLKEAVNILSQLFDEKGKLLVYTEGEHTKRMEYHSTGKPFYDIGNIVVLIDDGSASASEIIAGAIQDHDRGIIIGTESYGKGLVQEQYLLRNGGALRLTTARYYTASGRSIQKPYQNGESVNTDTIVVDSLEYFTKGGRTVYGGGGVTPDIEVEAPFDWDEMYLHGLYDWVLEYAVYGFPDMNEEEVQSFETFIESFPESEKTLEALISFWTDRDTRPFDSEVARKHWDEGYVMLRAMIASYYFGREGWYRMMLIDDPALEKALETIKEDRRTTLKY